MDYYDTHEIIKYASTKAIDISPADRQEWALFCCALKVLGYDLNTFIAMSNTTPEECKKVWRAEKNPNRYVQTEDNAKSKIIALAKAAGLDLSQFTLNLPSNYKMRVNEGNEGKRKLTDFDGIELPKKDPIYIAMGLVRFYENNKEQTALYNFLCSLFSPEEVIKVFEAYHIGATREFNTVPPSMATMFPYVNRGGNCVDVHMMPYDSSTGKRIKNGYSQNWLLTKNGQSNTRAPWCLFGEHLLDLNPAAPVGVVESEKTALIASICAPGFVWCATGSLSNLNSRRCQAVRGRNLYIFPDADGIDQWKIKAEQMRDKGFKVFFCSEFITNYAINPKDDLADILCRAAKEQRGGVEA